MTFGLDASHRGVRAVPSGLLASWGSRDSEDGGNMRRTRILFIVVSAIAAVILPSAAYASAADLHDCPDDYFCVWEEPNATGHFAKFQLGSSDLAKPINGHVFNDQVSYVWNRTTSVWCVYRDSGYSGGSLRISVEWQGPLGPRYSFDNVISSLRSCA
ncbi:MULTISPECIES: peptidase inhibitor family I36 protein [Amycolatopsis]|uniref:peptidase inhibitor family I36 protein n=1 Tax=Amycolatopsis sp. cg13 TaxID=3238807 RepID=UPI003524679F